MSLTFALGLIAIILVILYFVAHSEFNWIEVGTYFSAIFALANLVFFIVITIYVAGLQENASFKERESINQGHIAECKWDYVGDLKKHLNDIVDLYIGEKEQDELKDLTERIGIFCRSVKLTNDGLQQMFKVDSALKDKLDVVTNKLNIIDKDLEASISNTENNKQLTAAIGSLDEELQKVTILCLKEFQKPLS